ncbi:MAG: hypothetical protein R2857_07840 [Vampirovibrionales bacterium]
MSIKPGTVYQATDHETTPNDRWYVVNSHYELVKLIDGRPGDQVLISRQPGPWT